MMQILTYEQIDREAWSALVRESKTGNWFQSPEAFLFFSEQKDLFKPFVLAVAEQTMNDERLEIRGVCVGYVTVEKNAIKQYFMRRAIIQGGPALADDATEEEVRALMSAVRNILPSFQVRDGVRLSPIYIETRNFNDYSRWKGAFEAAGFAYQRHLNFHIDCTDKETMWERMSETRKRQVKRALKNGVKIYELESQESRNESRESRDEGMIREWYGILKQLYRTKVRTPLPPEEFFLEFYRQAGGIYLMVMHEEKVIGGIMCPVEGLRGTGDELRETGDEFPGTIYEWYICGMDAEYKECYPSVMATYAAMEYAAEKGLARFDVMGAGVPEIPYGVRDFKAEFGGQMVEQGRFIHICKPWLYRIGKWGVKMLRG